MASARERNGRWTGLYRDANGKQRSAGTYDTQEEALARAKVAPSWLWFPREGGLFVVPGGSGGVDAPAG
jgi:hypothetical protein